MAPLSPSTRARRAAAYYANQSAVYKRLGMTEAAERYEARAALASLDLQPACRRCGRSLETKESQELGIGPVCLHRVAESIRAAS